MKESDYNYWHKLVSTERPDELPWGCERLSDTYGWKPETRDPAVWGYLLRRWPKKLSLTDMSNPDKLNFKVLDAPSRARVKEIGWWNADWWSVSCMKWKECAGDWQFHTREDSCEIYRQRPAPKMRAMTRKEILAWASSADAFGWVVRFKDGAISVPPQCYSCCASNSTERARIETLNDNGTGGEWQAFEVEA